MNTITTAFANSVARADAHDRLATMLGYPVSRWIQYGTQQPHFYLVLVDSADSYVLGFRPEHLLSLVKFNNRLWDVGHVFVNSLKPKDWHEVLDLLECIREQVLSVQLGSAGNLELVTEQFSE